MFDGIVAGVGGEVGGSKIVDGDEEVVSSSGTGVGLRERALSGIVEAEVEVEVKERDGVDICDNRPSKELRLS